MCSVYSDLTSAFSFYLFRPGLLHHSGSTSASRFHFMNSSSSTRFHLIDQDKPQLLATSSVSSSSSRWTFSFRLQLPCSGCTSLLSFFMCPALLYLPDYTSSFRFHFIDRPSWFFSFRFYFLDRPVKTGFIDQLYLIIHVLTFRFSFMKTCHLDSKVSRPRAAST